MQVYETCAAYADGSLHNVIFSKATFLAEDGTLGGLIGTILDITERKQAELELAAQKEFADNLVQNSTTPTFVLDRQHRIIIWNRACEKLTGVPAAEMLGTDQTWKAFYDHKRPILADYIIDGNQEAIPEFYSSCSKSSLIPEGLQAEHWLPNLNGRAHYIFFTAAPIRNNRGELVAAIETIEDITDRKNREEQLHKLSQAVEQ
ncbi:MAG: PAS domain S-box protein, partial [Geobacter sp.]